MRLTSEPFSLVLITSAVRALHRPRQRDPYPVPEKMPEIHLHLWAEGTEGAEIDVLPPLIQRFTAPLGGVGMAAEVGLVQVAKRDAAVDPAQTYFYIFVRSIVYQGPSFRRFPYEESAIRRPGSFIALSCRSMG